MSSIVRGVLELMANDEQAAQQQTHKGCVYTSPASHKCNREIKGHGNYCVFHWHLEAIQFHASETLNNNIFLEQLEKEIESKNGQWQGFSFPFNFNWPNSIDFRIDMRWSKFESLKLENTKIF
jgi:hypothetical protein